MAATVELASLLSRDPQVKGGRLCIAGTGILVNRIAVLYGYGLSAEEMRSEFAGKVPLEGIHAAIAYYLANREAIDAQICAEDDETLRIAAEWKAAGRIR
ncbi:MAG: DUF433 domain-containing protein [Dehalococcoidia bacterium]|nr:DUF433 domain-containing protein [Dehalococcoidia bacterium]